MITNDGYEPLEQDIRRRLADLDQRYRAEAQPLIDILVQIQSTKPLPPMILTPAQLEVWVGPKKPCQD